MILTNVHKIPNQVYLKILSDLNKDPYLNIAVGTRIRVTELLKAPLPVSLFRENFKNNALIIDASDKLQTLFGTAVHSILEGEDTDEVKYEYKVVAVFDVANIGHVSVLGTIDEYWPDKNMIIDNKTALVSSINHPIDSDYEKQVNIYAYLLGLWDKQIPILKIRYLLKDWTKAAASRQPYDYPQSMIIERECPVMGKNDVEDLIKSRLIDHFLSPDRACTDQERNFFNEKPYSVMGANKSRAVRNFATAYEAQEFIMESGKPYTVVFKGDDMNCRVYCDSRSVCQYAKDKGYVV